MNRVRDRFDFGGCPSKSASVSVFARVEHPAAVVYEPSFKFTIAADVTMRRHHRGDRRGVRFPRVVGLVGRTAPLV